MAAKELKKDDFTHVCAITTRPPDIHYEFDYYVKPHHTLPNLVTVYTMDKKWLTVAHEKDFYIYGDDK